MQLTDLTLNSLCRIPLPPHPTCDLFVEEAGCLSSRVPHSWVLLLTHRCRAVFLMLFCSCELVLGTWSDSVCLGESRRWWWCWLLVTPAVSVPGRGSRSVTPWGSWGVAFSSPPPSTFWLATPRCRAFPPQAFAAPCSPFIDGCSSQGICVLAP